MEISRIYDSSSGSSTRSGLCLCRHRESARRISAICEWIWVR